MAEDLKADVIVVGGGLMGAASAFFLRKRGRSVILLERGLVGQQASGVNFGNVRRQGRFLPQLPLAHRSRAIWGRMKELLGEDAEFLVTGHVRGVYDEAQAAVVEQYAKDARGWGLELELVGGSAFRRRFPFFGSEVVCGSYSPNDGHANPRLAAPAFGRAAARAGARVIENCDVRTSGCRRPMAGASAHRPH
jgi:sarcosine oxidase subunit beta